MTKETAKTTKIVKRYHNRKLYDTVDSCYITLEEIGEMIRNGEDVRIIDNSTKEDITAITLAQIILEEQKKRKNNLPLDTFKELILSSGEAIKSLMSKGVMELNSVKSFVDDKVKPTVASIQRIPNFELEIKKMNERILKIEREIMNLRKCK